MKNFFKSKKIILLLTFFVILIIISLFLIISNSKTQISQILDLKKSSVTKQDLKKLVISSGKIISENEMQIFTQYNGEIIEVNVDLNDKINKDDIIAKIKTINNLGKEEEKEIKAPIQGTITKLFIKKNQIVSLQNPQIAEIVNLQNLKIQSSIPEAEIDQISKEQKVNLIFPALDDEKTTGKVSFISLAPINSQTDTPSYLIEVESENLPKDVLLGMNCDLEIIVEELNNVLALEDIYIYEKDNKKYVKELIKYKNDNVEIRDSEIKTGFEGESKVEIVSGIRENSEVVLPTEELKAQRNSINFFAE